MIITLLCIAFSQTLNFEGLTLPILFDWYCNHPFLFLLAVGETLCTNVSVRSKK